MSEIIKERVEKSKGKFVTIFLTNEFRFAGELIKSDEKYLEILDARSNAFKIIIIDDIKDMEIKQ